MPELRPFRAWRPAPDLAPILADLLVPPYDVITPAEQAALYERHPDNLIRLELGRELPDDDQRSNRYTRAADALADWRSRGIWQRDAEPALYLYQQVFRMPGHTQPLTRSGLLASLRLAPWGQGILPHEKTFAGAKADRLALLEQTRVETGAIFTFVRQAGAALFDLLSQAAQDVPDAQFSDARGVTHRLWPLTDADLIARIGTALAGQTLYVADGHHRYETALNYQATHGAGDGSRPADYVLVYVAAISDPGLQVLAAHRCLHDVPGLETGDVRRRLENDFDFDYFAGIEPLQAALAQGQAGAGWFGLLEAGTPGGWLLRPHADLRLPADMPRELAALDVNRLQEWVLAPILRNISSDLADKRFVSYEPFVAQILPQLAAGQLQACFLLNPVSLPQLCAVAEAGQVMPHKATFFYPKLYSGIVVHDVASF